MTDPKEYSDDPRERGDTRELDVRTVTLTFNPKPGRTTKLEIAGLAVPQKELSVKPPVLPVSPPAITPVRSRKRQPVPLVQERNRRIREIPRDFSTPEYLRTLDAMQRPFRTKDNWQKEGCPATYVEAFKDLRWRQKIYNERQNAWRKPKKGV